VALVTKAMIGILLLKMLSMLVVDAVAVMSHCVVCVLYMGLRALIILDLVVAL
jgi:hypothetical protein